MLLYLTITKSAGIIFSFIQITPCMHGTIESPALPLMQFKLFYPLTLHYEGVLYMPIAVVVYFYCRLKRKGFNVETAF